MGGNNIVRLVAAGNNHWRWELVPATREPGEGRAATSGQSTGHERLVGQSASRGLQLGHGALTSVPEM